jgi:hypothetical protein
MLSSVYYAYTLHTSLSSFQNMNNIADIMTNAQIATALAIIAFVVVATLLRREAHKHK